MESIILARPNRFIMRVELDGNKTVAHCPSTGRIGNIIFDHIPCLLSQSDNLKRKTRYTVEAISLDSPNAKKKQWIGINQTKANQYVEFFLVNGAMPKIVRKGETLTREKRLGRSRIDFATDDTLIEMKTPLITLPTSERRVAVKSRSKFDSFDRLIKHFNDLARAIKEDRKKRAVILLCYLYDAPAFAPPKTDQTNVKIKKAAKLAANTGVENWQVNLRLTKDGVRLMKYFHLKLFEKKPP